MRTKRFVLFLFTGLFIGVLIWFGSTGFADSTSTEVRLELPEGFEPLALHSVEDDGFLVSATDGSDCFILLLDEYGAVLDRLQLSGHPLWSVLSESKLYLVCPQKDDLGASFSSTKLLNIAIQGQALRTGTALILEDFYCAAPKDFAADSQGNLYFINRLHPQTLSIYQGSLKIRDISTNRGTFHAVSVSPNNQLYTAYTEETMLGIFPLDTVPLEDLPLEESDIPDWPCRFVGEGLAIDSGGIVYSHQSHSGIFTRLWETGSESCETACLLPNGTLLCKTDSSFATEYEDGTAAYSYQFDGDLWFLAHSGNQCVGLVGRDGSFFLTPLDLTNKNEIIPPISSMPESSEPLPTPDYSIHSDQYKIDRDEQLIYVPSHTTYAALKGKLTLGEGTLSARKPNDTSLVSGYVMTGAILELTVNGQITDALTVIVPGDLTGTGSVSSSDSRLLYNHLGNSAELTGSARFAADLDEDGEITTADLLEIKKILEG